MMDTEFSKTVELVWAALQEGTWMSADLLKEASGLDNETLNEAVNFLHRLRFVEVQMFPELSVRKKEGVMSPMAIFEALDRITQKDYGSPARRGSRRIVQRVACRKCNGRRFKYAGQNQVECVNCHERQWFKIEVNQLWLA